MTHAAGTFEVKIRPTGHSPASSIQSLSLDKSYEGHLVATGKGEMLAAGDPSKGNAGYVAIERVSGTLAGHKGTFAIMQLGVMETGNTPQLQVLIVPGSGTGDLKGITGTLKIIIEEAKHYYEMDYEISPG